ncbi:MAG: riboflavin biosynthesis protein RibF, partial [Rhodothermales bacterium]
REVLRDERVPLLTTVEERAEILATLHLDRFIVLPFTQEFASLSAREFVQRILVGEVGLKEVVIGYDHTFGKDREGTADLLREMAPHYGFSVDVIPPQVVGRDVVSSTQIRRALGEGDVKRAASQLGRPYSLRGTVVHGDKRGRLLGFPTANLSVDPRKIKPRSGVYAVRVTGNMLRADGMMNIGKRPTVGGTALTLEVHLLDYDGDLYDAELRIEFIERLRDEQRFPSLEELKKQLSVDRARCIAALESVP